MLREELHNTSIEDLLDSGKISVRSANCCNNERFKSLYDIISYYEQGDSFLNIRNAGRQTCMELESLCEEIISQIEEFVSDKDEALTQLKKEQEKARKNEVKELIERDIASAINSNTITSTEFLNYLSKIHKEILEKKYIELLSLYSARALNVLSGIGFIKFVEEYLFDAENISNIRYFGKKKMEDVLDFREKLINEISELINFPEDELIRTNIIFAINNNLITPAELLKCLYPNQKAILEKKYTELLSAYSIRVKNRLSEIGFIEYVEEYLFNSNDFLNIRHLGRKSLKDGLDFRKKLITEISKFINLPEDVRNRENLIHNKGE